MTANTKPMFGDTLGQIADLLDKCENVFGPIKPDVRARIFAAVDNPTSSTWERARTSIVRKHPETTFWQAVITHTGIYPEATPTRTEMIHALTMVTLAAKTEKEG